MGELIRFPIERRQEQIAAERLDTAVEYVVHGDGFFGVRIRPPGGDAVFTAHVTTSGIVLDTPITFNAS